MASRKSSRLAPSINSSNRHLRQGSLASRGYFCSCCTSELFINSFVSIHRSPSLTSPLPVIHRQHFTNLLHQQQLSQQQLQLHHDRRGARCKPSAPPAPISPLEFKQSARISPGSPHRHCQNEEAKNGTLLYFKDLIVCLSLPSTNMVDDPFVPYSLSSIHIDRLKSSRPREDFPFSPGSQLGLAIKIVFQQGVTDTKSIKWHQCTPPQL